MLCCAEIYPCWYREVASNEPLSKLYVHIVFYQIKQSLITGVLIDIFKLFQMHYVFLFYLFRKIKKIYNHVTSPVPAQFPE